MGVEGRGWGWRGSRKSCSTTAATSTAAPAASTTAAASPQGAGGAHGKHGAAVGAAVFGRSGLRSRQHSQQVGGGVWGYEGVDVVEDGVVCQWARVRTHFFVAAGL